MTLKLHFSIDGRLIYKVCVLSLLYVTPSTQKPAAFLSLKIYVKIYHKNMEFSLEKHMKCEHNRLVDSSSIYTPFDMCPFLLFQQN